MRGGGGAGAGEREEVVEEVLELLDEVLPDPVDVYEDELAREAGLVRGPECDRETWRRVRGRWVDEAGE